MLGSQNCDDMLILVQLAEAEEDRSGIHIAAWTYAHGAFLFSSVSSQPGKLDSKRKQISS